MASGGTGDREDGERKVKQQEKRTGLRSYVLLHVLLMVYSLSNVFSKLAAGESFLSVRFCLFYGGTLLLLAVYALGWQQIIRAMPLTTAFAHKAVTVVWGIAWGLIFFQEAWNWGKGFGAVLIIAGILLFSTEAEAQEERA